MHGILSRSIHEFVQEDESDGEFLEMFTRWLHEEEVVEGYVDTYMIFYLRYAQKLSNDEFKYLERNGPVFRERTRVALRVEF